MDVEKFGRFDVVLKLQFEVKIDTHTHRFANVLVIFEYIWGEISEIHGNGNLEDLILF